LGYQRFRGPCYLHLQGEVKLKSALTTRRHNPQDLDLNLNRHEIIKSRSTGQLLLVLSDV